MKAIDMENRGVLLEKRKRIGSFREREWEWCIRGSR
jgi:hypothetical protein